MLSSCCLQQLTVASRDIFLRPPTMVCEKCEKKLSKAAVPEVWKEGSRSAGAGRDGGRSVARNTMLKSNSGFAPHLKTCRVCKTKLSQDAAYCNQCAFAKGICASGVAIADLRMDKRGMEWPGARNDAFADDGDGDGDEEADEAAAGSGANAAGDGAKTSLRQRPWRRRRRKRRKEERRRVGGAAAGRRAIGRRGVSAGVDMEAIARRMAAARNATVATRAPSPAAAGVAGAPRASAAAAARVVVVGGGGGGGGGGVADSDGRGLGQGLLLQRRRASRSGRRPPNSPQPPAEEEKRGGAAVRRRRRALHRYWRRRQMEVPVDASVAARTTTMPTPAKPSGRVDSATQR